MRNRRKVIATGVLLTAAGIGFPYLRAPALILLIGIGFLMLLWIRFANPGRFVGAILGWVFLTDAKADWRTIRRTGASIGSIAVVALAPPGVWVLVTAAGLGLLAGVAARPGVQAVAPRLRVPTVDVDMGDRFAAWRFRKTYPERAVELGWDKDRKGAKDRMRVPALIEARRVDGDWTCVFLSRGDWTPDEWEKQAHALRRSLDGRTVRVSHQGRRVVVQVWTKPLPECGEIQVTEPPRITEDGILIGHDPARREVRWAADDSTAHGLLVGAPGAGKSHLAGVMLLGAAATPGWEGVMLDAKQTHDWTWLTRYGVRVIRQRGEIHEYLAWLEGERNRIEDAGQGAPVTRLVMLDEARLVVGTHKGPDQKQREATIAVAGDLTGLGRSAGIRLVPIIQRPDVEHIGGGYLRDNLTLRVALGRLEGDGIGMVFEGRQVSPEERRELDGTPGRAIVSGLRGGDLDGWLVQVPELAVPHETTAASAAASTSPVTPQDTPEDGDGSARQVMRGRVTQCLVEHGPTLRRTRVAYLLGVEATDSTLRRACQDLIDEGVVRDGRGGRGAVTLTLVAGESTSDPDVVPGQLGLLGDAATV